MNVILDMAISPNGLIAREDGDEDWLSSDGWDDFVLEAKQHDNIVMGRETYEQVTRRYEDYNFDSIDCKFKVIVTRDNQFKAPNSYHVVYSPEEAIEFIKSKHLKTFFLIGGGKLNAEFLKRRLVNQIQLTLNPYIIGKGRSFIDSEEFDARLKLLSHQELSNGRLRVIYQVEN
jgi:dihydrofolate reductase